MHPAVSNQPELQPRADGAATILRLLSASSPNWPEVALVVARDPALSLALLVAQPLAEGELADGLNTVLRHRLERIGSDLLRAWLLGLGSRGSAIDAAPDRALMRAECALHLAMETGYARPDEAYLAGLWRGFGACARSRGNTSADTRRAARTTRPLAELVRDCGLPASLGDALELGAVMEEQLQGAHPLLRLSVAAERLADDDWQERLDEIARLSGLAEPTLTSLRTDIGYIVSGHAAYPPPAAGSTALDARPPASLAEDPYRSAGMLGLLTAAFVDLERTEIEDRLAIACPLFGLPAAPVLLSADAAGRLAPMLDTPPGSPAALIEELHLRLDDEASTIALCARSEQVTVFAPQGGRPGRSLADWQVARWLGGDGFCCLPLTTNGHPSVALIAIDHGNELASELQWRYAALLGAAVRALRAALRQQHALADREALLQQRFREHVRKIAHEATNPLTVLKSRLEMLGLERPEDAPLQNEMVLLNTELDRIDNLLRSAGDLPVETVEPARCRVPELLLDLRSIYGDALFNEHGIQLELRAAKGVPVAAIPPSALKQVLLNLFRNASEALLPGQRLVVSVSSQVSVDGKSCVEIRLVDNGPGLPADRVADLFSPRPSSKGGGHQGVGLSIVREILSQWNATILCRSQPGSGTSFQIFLPLEHSV